jgi:hypothetical protein
MNKNGILYNVDHFIETINSTKHIIRSNNVSDNLFLLSHEEFIFNPKLWLKKLLNFLDIEYSVQYLNLCCSKVFDKPNIVFNQNDWSNKEIKRVDKFIRKGYPI